MTGELASVVTEQELRHSTLLFCSVQRSHHIFSFQALACFDRDTLPCVHIDDCQRPETRSILQLIGHEVDAPSPIRRCSDELLFAMSHGFPLALWPLLQGQALFLVQPVHQILTCVPALAVQQHADLAISIAHSCLSDFADPHPQVSDVEGVWLISMAEGFETSAFSCGRSLATSSVNIVASWLAREIET